MTAMLGSEAVSWYFAYGSNMNPQRMAARGIETTERIAAFLPDFQLKFNKRAHAKQGVAYANIRREEGGTVYGALYKLKHPQDIIALDPFEGTPVRYGREVFELSTSYEGGVKIIPAWIYTANDAWLDETVLPEAAYLKHLLAGADLYPASYKDWLSAQPVLPKSESAHPADGLRFN
jgi:hypothetical protein